MVEDVEIARAKENAVVVVESDFPGQRLSVDQDLCPRARTDGDRIIVAVVQDGVFLLYAQSVDEDFWKRRGFLVPDTALSLLDKVYHHVRQLGIFVEVPEMGRGLPTFLLLLFSFIPSLYNVIILRLRVNEILVASTFKTCFKSTISFTGIPPEEVLDEILMSF